MINIIIALADKLLPEIIKKFIPLVKIQPKNLKFTESEWKSEFSFFLHSRYKQILFDIYLLIKIGNAKTEDFELSKTNMPKNLKISINNIEIDYEILRLNCIYEDDREFILLKIAQMDPKSFTPFKITTNKNCKVKFKILKHSKKQNKILHNSQEGAISFEIPLKKKEKIRLKSVDILIKKND